MMKYDTIQYHFLCFKLMIINQPSLSKNYVMLDKTIERMTSLYCPKSVLTDNFFDILNFIYKLNK